MDHQQNYEYSDPNFGFINTFTGSDGFLMAQQGQQQLNGKSDILSTPLESFESNPAPSQYMEQPSQLYLPMISQETPLYQSVPDSYHHISSSIDMPSQKDPMFSLEHPPEIVPVNIIQQPEKASAIAEPIVHHLESIVQTDSQLQELQQSLLTTPVKLPSTSTEKQPSDEILPEATSSSAEKELPSVFSPEQNNMMKALGVVRRVVLAPMSGSKKRRRRILQLNEDDSDDENEFKKELLQVSPEKEKEKEVESEDSSLDSDSDDPSNDDPRAFKARSLLKSAVIIQGPESKKKKKRVLESDEEDAMMTSVDDIGMIETNEDELNDEDLLSNDIIVTETAYEIEESDKVEDPTVVAEEIALPSLQKDEETGENVAKSDENPADTETEKTAPSTVKKENAETPAGEELNSIVKTEEGDIDPSMSVEAILDTIKPMADDE